MNPRHAHGLALFFVSSLALGCVPVAASMDAQSSSDTQNAADASDRDSSLSDTLPFDASPIDASSPDVVATDVPVTDVPADAADGPRPPADSFLCGEGTLSSQDIQTACNQPPQFPLTAPVNCSAITASSAHYRVYCPRVDNSYAYVWVEIPDAVISASGCQIATLQSVVVEASSGSGSGRSSTITFATLRRTPRRVTLNVDLSWGGSTGRTGGFRLFPLFDVTGCTGLGTQLHSLGVSGQWDGRDQ